jgi:hypothetical protein
MLARYVLPTLRRLEAMGLLETAPVERLDLEGLRRMLALVAKQGIGEAAIHAIVHAKPSAERELSRALEQLSSALIDSPVPEHEWPKLEAILGLDLLSRLIGISESSARRYINRERKTPTLVATRLHFLALLIADLSGAYNELGVRAWFERRRTVLTGKAPVDLLTGDWQPEDEGPARVRELAEALTGSPAT